MNIPDEAVEAASKAVYESRYADLRVWEDLDIADQDEIREEQAIALESAAPHLMAAAWDEGWDTFASFDSRPGGPYPLNPYRKPDDARG